MKNIVTASLLSSAVYAAALFAPIASGDIFFITKANATEAQQLDKPAVELIIRDYLLNNPELLLEVQEALEEKQVLEAQVAQAKIIADNKQEIFNNPADTVYGNPDGDITIVEFYDYNCGYCKHAMPDMIELTKADPNLRFVLKEFPILGPDSSRTHLVSQAFKKLMPEKYMELHEKLMSEKGRSTEETTIAAAVALGADEAKLREMMQNNEVITSFQSAYKIAQALNISGTPSYIIGEQLVPGAVGKDTLAEKITELRAKQAEKL